MKTLILQLIFVLSMTLNGYSDDNIDFLFRHAKGSKGIVFSFGAESKGFYSSLGYSYYFAKNYILDGSFMYDNGKISLTDFSSYRLAANNHLNFYSIKKFYFSNSRLWYFSTLSPYLALCWLFY